MSVSTCSSCHNVLRFRLRSYILALQQQRRSLNTSPVAPRPRKGAHIVSQYVDTIPPTASQLQAATHFFAAHTPTKSWTATEWRKHISQHSTSFGDIIPEVAFLGRSNSGKSSLLNALLDDPGLCRVGPRPGKTTTMHAWSLAPFSERRSRAKKIDVEPKMTVLDMPGYGHGSRTEWGQEIIKYMRRRRQLRRAFLLLNPKHGVKASDEQILQVLRAEGIVHQIIACKCDDLKASEFTSRLEQLRETVTKSAVDQEARGLLLSDMLVVGNLGDGKANQRVESGNMKGVENVRWAILQATGLDEYAAKQYADDLKSQHVQQPLRIIEPRLSSSNPQLAEQSVSI